MSISAHDKVERHYEAYPYPSYPWFLGGRWKDLQNVDLAQWGATVPIQSVWLCGCGTTQPLMFGRRNPRVRFFATDLSARSLRWARWRCWLYGVHNIQFEKSDLMDTSFESRFEIIDAYGVLHHTASPQESLRVLWKALKPGGVLRLMLYSNVGRRAYRGFRQKLHQEITNPDLKKAKAWLKSQEIRDLPELQSHEGIADSLLHPLEHFFERSELEESFKGFTDLEILSWEETPNHLLRLRKKII